MYKIKKFFECLIPSSVCNLRCSYCYIIQRDKRDNKIPLLKYSTDIIGQSLTKERLGGICYFSICGEGETLIPDYTVNIIHNILKNGHFVNVTTNGTLTNRFEEILEFPKEYLSRLHISFSLHYIELIRTNNLESFFNNINLIRNAGCSFLVQLNLCDEYIPLIQEIKKICIEKVGSLPQVAATRKEINNSQIELFTDYTKEEYINFGKEFESPLFSFTMNNFGVKRTEFCYAGDWSFVLNLQTGIMKRCYSSYIYQNIFKNINKPIKTLAIGKGCNSQFCFNASHFMSLGVIPDIETPSYAFLRDREESMWYTSNMKLFLSDKLYNSNEEYGGQDKWKSKIVLLLDNALKILWDCFKLLKKTNTNIWEKEE